MGDEKDTQLSQAQEFEAADNLPDRFKSVSEPSATPIVDPAYTSISGIVNAYC
jgi:hypothetical protein